MFNKNAWRQPFEKSDLLAVLLNGLIFGVIGGILAGLLDYLFYMLNVNISFSLLIVAYFVGSRIRKSYYSYHILYPTTTILFLIIGFVFSDITYLLCAYRTLEGLIHIFNPLILFRLIIQPIYSLISNLINFDMLGFLISGFNFVMYIFAYIYAYRLAKGRN